MTSNHKLNAIVTKALVDKGFRARLLNGSRQESISDFNLSIEETGVVMSIEAITLDQFIHQLGECLVRVEVDQLSLH